MQSVSGESRIYDAPTYRDSLLLIQFQTHTQTIFVFANLRQSIAEYFRFLYSHHSNNTQFLPV